MSNVFIGDSVTDCDRLSNPPYGQGWVNEIVRSGKLQDVINVGVSGERLIDLENRWERDVIANKPNRLTVDIGINETGHRYNKNNLTTVEEFESRYDKILKYTLGKFELELILCEPFFLSVKPEMELWDEDLNPKIEAIHRLANKHNAKLVKFNEMFRKMAQTEGNEVFAEDGVHPTYRGHEEMAKLWLKVVLDLS